MKYLCAYAVGFVAVLFLAGYANIMFAIIDWATTYMTGTTFALIMAAVGGLVGMALLRWFEPPRSGL